MRPCAVRSGQPLRHGQGQQGQQGQQWQQGQGQGLSPISSYRNPLLANLNIEFQTGSDEGERTQMSAEAWLRVAECADTELAAAGGAAPAPFPHHRNLTRVDPHITQAR